MLLVDELDRADDEFEAFLLEVLSDFTVTVPELGTIAAEEPPVVVITSNRTRELHDALKRRCLYHWIDFPDVEREAEIIRLRAPGRRGAAGAVGGGDGVPAARFGSRQAPGRGGGDRLGARRSRSWAPTSVNGDAARETLGAAVKNREDAVKQSFSPNKGPKTKDTGGGKGRIH